MLKVSLCLCRRWIPVLGGFFLLATGAGAPAVAGEGKAAAFFGMRLVNTTLAETTEAERARLQAIADRLVEGLEANGYSFVDTSAVQDRAKLYDNLSHCNGCDSSFAAELGADLAVSGEVQKTSNLILHINVYMREAGTGRLVNGGSVDIRSNTDESWMRGMNYILKNRILRE